MMTESGFLQHTDALFAHIEDQIDEGGWDFDCRFGADKGSAQTVHPGELFTLLDALANEGAPQCYVELLAKPGVRQPRPAVAPAEPLDDPSESA